MSTISSLTELTASGFAAGDNLPVDDISTTTTKRVEAQNLLDAILRVANAGDVLMLDATGEKIIIRQRGGTPGTDEVQISHDGTYTQFLDPGASSAFVFTIDATGRMCLSTIQMTLGSTLTYGWSTGSNPSAGSDTALGRRVAGEVEVTNASTGRRDLAARTLIARQDGGVVGTDEVQVYHDGTNGSVKAMSGYLGLFAPDDTGIRIVSGGEIQGAQSSTSFLSNCNSVRVGSGGPLFASGTGSRLSNTDQYTWASGDAGVTASDTGEARASAGVVRDTDGSTGLGKRLTGTLVEANTAGSGSPNILTAVESRTALTNEGATAENYHTLPTAAAGLDFEFVCQDSDGIRVTANTGDTIRDVGTVSASAGYIRSSTVGSVIRLKAINATEWFVVYKQGTWTIDS